MPFDDPACFRLDRVPVRPIHWLWRPYLACGKLALLDGDPRGGRPDRLALPGDLKEPDFDALRGRDDFQKPADAPMPGEKKGRQS